MSVNIFSESAISFERFLVYLTVFENFVVLIQHRRKNDLWYTHQHCLIPKLFINAIAAIPEKTEPSESSIITSGGHLTQNYTTNAFNWRNFAGRSETYLLQIRLRLCAVIRESTRHLSSLQKLGWYMGCQIITILTGQSATEFFSQCSNNSCCGSKPICYSNPKPLTLWGFSEEEQDLWQFCKYKSVWCQNFIWFKLQTPQQQTNSANFKTPNCLDTPLVCAAPKTEDKKTL